MTEVQTKERNKVTLAMAPVPSATHSDDHAVRMSDKSGVSNGKGSRPLRPQKSAQSQNSQDGDEVRKLSTGKTICTTPSVASGGLKSVREPIADDQEEDWQAWNRTHALKQKGRGTKELNSEPLTEPIWIQRCLPMKQAEQVQVWRCIVFEWLANVMFNRFIGAVIVTNAVTVGLDQHFHIMGLPLNHPAVRTLAVLEHIFLTIYTIEVLMRFFCLGVHCLADHWVKFDVLLVIAGLVNFVLLEVVVSDSPTDRDTGPLMVLRLGRLLRLARTAKLLVKFQVLWMLVCGLVRSGSTMFYTLVMLGIMLYISSCIGFEMITSNDLAREDAEFAELVDTWFPDLPGTMLTMLQFVSMDSIGAIYRPLIEKQPSLVIYFVGIILLVPVVLMNLVTAVIVNGAIEQAESDKEAMAVHEELKKKKMLRELRRIFMQLDEDGSGMICTHEWSQISNQDKQVLAGMINAKNPESIFQALDVDGSGELDIDEFCDGIWQVAISGIPLEIKRMEIMMHHIHRILLDTREDHLSVKKEIQDFRELQKDLHASHDEFQAGMATFQDEVKKNIAESERQAELIHQELLVLTTPRGGNDVGCDKELGKENNAQLLLPHPVLDEPTDSFQEVCEEVRGSDDGYVAPVQQAKASAKGTSYPQNGLSKPSQSASSSASQGHSAPATAANEKQVKDLPALDSALTVYALDQSSQVIQSILEDLGAIAEEQKRRLNQLQEKIQAATVTNDEKQQALLVGNSNDGDNQWSFGDQSKHHLQQGGALSGTLFGAPAGTRTGDLSRKTTI